MMPSCAIPINLDSSPKVSIPNLPLSVQQAGTYVIMPKGPYSAKKLLPTVVASDRKNARAVNSCKNYHKTLKLLYSKNKV